VFPSLERWYRTAAVKEGETDVQGHKVEEECMYRTRTARNAEKAQRVLTSVERKSSNGIKRTMLLCSYRLLRLQRTFSSMFCENLEWGEQCGRDENMSAREKSVRHMMNAER
jgi:hypothetical protein